jgi:hypothetical protein
MDDGTPLYVPWSNYKTNFHTKIHEW